MSFPRIHFTLAALVLGICQMTAAVAQAKTEVYVLAGQSNAERMANSGSFKRLQKRNDFQIVKVTLTGTPLAPDPLRPDWSPSRNESPDSGEMLVRFEGQIETALRDGGQLRRIVWAQGESDTATAERAAAYGERLEKLLARWREAYGADVEIVVIALPSHSPYAKKAKTNAHWQAVRSAQLRIPDRFPGVEVIDPDLVLSPQRGWQDPFTDGLHYHNRAASALTRAAFPELFSTHRKLGSWQIFLMFVAAIVGANFLFWQRVRTR